MGVQRGQVVKKFQGGQLERGHHGGRNALRAQLAVVDPADADGAAAEQFGLRAALLRFQERSLLDCHGRTACFHHPRCNQKQIIQPRRSVVLQLGLAHDEHAAELFAQALLLDAQGAQPLGAGALEELEVVGVEHDAAGVGVFPVHAHGPCERRRLAARAGSQRLLQSSHRFTKLSHGVGRGKAQVAAGVGAAEVAPWCGGQLAAVHELKSQCPAAAFGRVGRLAAGCPSARTARSHRPRRRRRRRASPARSGPGG